MHLRFDALLGRPAVARQHDSQPLLVRPVSEVVQTQPAVHSSTSPGAQQQQQQQQQQGQVLRCTLCFAVQTALRTATAALNDQK